MVEIRCPWCEEGLPLDIEPVEMVQSCPSCLTTWSYVDEPATGMAAAA
jgi:hypothetical protein